MNEQPIRVLALIGESADVSGPAKNLFRFCRLAASGRPAASVRLATFFRCAGDREPDTPFVQAARAAGVELEIVRERRRFDSGVRAQLAQLIAKIDPGLIQTHGVKPHFLARSAGWWRARPWLAFHHGYTTEDLKMRLYNQLDRWSLPGADRVVTVCTPFAERIAASGVPRDRIDVLPNSIEPAPPAGEDPRVLRAKYGIVEERLILTVGRQSREKGHADLLEAAAMLRRRNAVPFRLVLVGDGPERKRLESGASQLGLADCAIFAGQQRSVFPFYRAADLFVLPSLSEGSPNVVLEAMSAGLPIVATAVGGVPDTVRDGHSALLVPPRRPEALTQAMSRVLDDTALAATLGGNARRDVAAFTPEAYRDRLIEIYRSVLASRGRG